MERRKKIFLAILFHLIIVSIVIFVILNKNKITNDNQTDSQYTLRKIFNQSQIIELEKWCSNVSKSEYKPFETFESNLDDSFQCMHKEIHMNDIEFNKKFNITSLSEILKRQQEILPIIFKDIYCPNYKKVLNCFEKNKDSFVLCTYNKQRVRSSFEYIKSLSKYFCTNDLSRVNEFISDDGFDCWDKTRISLMECPEKEGIKELTNCTIYEKHLKCIIETFKTECAPKPISKSIENIIISESNNCNLT